MRIAITLNRRGTSSAITNKNQNVDEGRYTELLRFIKSPP